MTNEGFKAISIPDPTGSRFSRRVRGMNDGVIYDPNVLALVERRKSGFRVQKAGESPSKTDECGVEQPATTNGDKEEREETQGNNSNEDEKVAHDEDRNEDEIINGVDMETPESETVKRNLEFTDNLDGMIGHFFM